MVRGYKKSHIDRFYFWKHLGTRLGIYCLTIAYLIQTEGLPQTKQDWFVFVLLNIATLFGAGISIKGAKQTAS